MKTNNTIRAKITRISTTLTATAFLFAATLAPLVTNQASAAPEPTDVPAFVDLLGGSQGTNDGEFAWPRGIALDDNGNVYVADSENNRIQKFDSNGTYLAQWGSAGSGNSEFNYPYGIALDDSGNIYVADSNNNRIQKFDSNGTYLAQWGSAGSGNSEFNLPYAVAVSAGGSVYVADASNHRIQKFDSDGTYLTQWGSQGSDSGDFFFTGGVAVDSLDNVYVADSNNHRIQKFDSDGTYLTQWGSNGSGNSEFNYPSGIALDDNGNVYVADSENNRIQKFDSNGTYLAQWGSAGSGNSEFNLPYAVAVSAGGSVYVADANNNRIQKFSYPPESASLSAPVSGNDILLEAAPFTTFTCSEAVSAGSLAVQDEGKEYPLGLVDFCLEVESGSTQSISITFETSLTPDQVTARKYNPNTQVYTDVPDANITSTTLNSSPALLLTYDITDGGDLDDDGLANGTILDPVGLAIDSAVAAELAEAALADTGTNNQLIQLAAITLLATPVLLQIRRLNYSV